MKSYTDLNQSKRLAEILSLKSADMHYARAYFEGKKSDWFIGLGKPIKSDDIIPCWSLAALLNVIPYTIYKSDNEFYRLGIDKGYDDYAIWYNNNGFTITDLDVTSDNFVDACFAMIEKLHEQKLL